MPFQVGATIPLDELEGALTALRSMAENNDPAAMHLLGQVLWDGLLVERDVLGALLLFESAIALNHPPALVSIGAYYHANAKSEADFERAANYYKAYFDWRQEEETRLGGEAVIYAQNQVRLGEVGLTEREFFRSFAISMNGVSYTATTTVLKQINDWRLAAKRKVIEIQKKLYKRNPGKSSFNPRTLPLAPMNGFCATGALVGDQCITHLELSLGWEGQLHRACIPLTDFGVPKNGLPNLRTLKEFACPIGCVPANCADEIRVAIDAPPSFSLRDAVINRWHGFFNRRPEVTADYKQKISMCIAVEGAGCRAFIDGREIFSDWRE
ncbi:hypothetical protein GBK02_02715 [Dechloromonas sp. TW-R-39-2]|uniref:tetratricopeptide repeat protein n=1 Tax=Dechloromonas sp. TW-R-39-2 TaxID=2654218 RepID=UPI00193E7BEC|nr:sel1 repeat family protein [Dechloromonas sp. TW-R-39-2]QRM18386.1 hypothetical protein GBK02_02715 [Dechloromonas sp. TW-R-39-2]